MTGRRQGLTVHAPDPGAPMPPRGRRQRSPVSERPPGAPWPLDATARYLGVSARHLLRLADMGKVRTIRLGRRRLIPDPEVQRLARDGC